jgi:cell division protein FtsI/penicillin-binding protein 2
MPPQQQSQKQPHILARARTWYAVLLFIFVLIMVRLFYLQVIRHSYYRDTALAGQFKEYEVAPERGMIQAHDGDKVVPLVLNEERFTLFADPKYVKDPEAVAAKIQKVIGGDQNEYIDKMKADTRYAILKKKLSRQQQEAITDLELKGVGTKSESQRVYPQGTLAAQLLGFVNDEGEGKYGVEQFLNKDLQGKPGQLKAVTDAKGVPLVANSDNVIVDPVPGEEVVLTIDVPMQRQLETILKEGLDKAKAKSGSALIMDPNTGAIKAMANYPTYNPAEFYKQEDAAVFSNAAVSSPLEIGSVMKPLTAAAALNTGAVQPGSSYFDPGSFTVDEKKITNVEEVRGSGTRTVADILKMSLNTGATWLLMQMGGGQINEKARTTWHDYMTNHYRFGKATGVEQGYEQDGVVPSPTDGYGLNIQYANTSFGQGMSATPLQVGAAISSILNGGTYYRPYLVDKVVLPDGEERTTQPEVVRKDVVSPAVSATIKDFMQQVVQTNHTVYGMKTVPANYIVGGKTGTAQITRPEGGYYEDKYNGMFMGFVGGDKPEYVIIVRVNEPGIPGYAGSKAAGPIFTASTEMLINNFALTPKSQ